MESVKIICPQQQTKQTRGTVAAQPEREYLNLIINNKPLIMRPFFLVGRGGVFALENVKSLQTYINTICYQPFLSLKKGSPDSFYASLQYSIHGVL